MNWEYLSGLVKFMFEDMFMNGFWNGVWNGLGITALLFGIGLAIYRLFLKRLMNNEL